MTTEEVQPEPEDQEPEPTPEPEEEASPDRLRTPRKSRSTKQNPRASHRRRTMALKRVGIPSPNYSKAAWWDHRGAPHRPAHC